LDEDTTIDRKLALKLYLNFAKNQGGGGLSVKFSSTVASTSKRLPKD
jgi:hypothetical protein